REPLARGDVRPVQPHAAVFHLSPDAALRLYDPKETWLVTRLQRLQRLRRRLVCVKMKNRSPPSRRTVARPFPLFDREESLRHGYSYLSIEAAPPMRATDRCNE